MAEEESRNHGLLGSSPIPGSNCMKKKFVFRLKKNHQILDAAAGGSESGGGPGAAAAAEEYDTLEIIIQELMQGTNSNFGLYIWPSATVLSWYIFLHRDIFRGKRVLELGSGCSLPGILCALCGAQVILSDSAKFPHCLDLARKNVELNGLTDQVQVVGITWGLFLHPLAQFKNQFDLIIGSDCFFDPTLFEDLIATVAYLLENNPKAKFLTTYQERSSDWSIESLLIKWGLVCNHIPLNDLANLSEIDLPNLMQDHTIHLLEITQKI